MHVSVPRKDTGVRDVHFSLLMGNRGSLVYGMCSQLSMPMPANMNMYMYMSHAHEHVHVGEFLC